MNSFTSYGSCVTREIFNALGIKPLLTIGQNPISTMFKPAINFDIEDYECETNFDKRMLFYDANKLSLSKILEAESEYFVFDITSERVKLMEMEYQGKKTCVEKSWPFVHNFLKLIKNPKYKGLKKIRDINVEDLGSEYDEYIDSFCEIISQKYESKKIIYIEAKLVDYYIDKSNTLKKFNTEEGYKIISDYNLSSYANNVLKRVQDRILQNLNNINVIPFPENTFADESHYLGLHPLHYSLDYYNYAATAIDVITDVNLDNTDLFIHKLWELQSKSNQLSKTRIENVVGNNKIYSDIEIIKKKICDIQKTFQNS